MHLFKNVITDITTPVKLPLLSQGYIKEHHG